MHANRAPPNFSGELSKLSPELAKFAAVELQLNDEGKYYGVTTLFLEDANPRGKPYESRGGRVLLWPVAQAAPSGADAPFPAATNDAGAAAADARESKLSVDPS